MFENIVKLPAESCVGVLIHVKNMNYSVTFICIQATDLQTIF